MTDTTLDPRFAHIMAMFENSPPSEDKKTDSALVNSVIEYLNDNFPEPVVDDELIKAAYQRVLNQRDLDFAKGVELLGYLPATQQEYLFPILAVKLFVIKYRYASSYHSKAYITFSERYGNLVNEAIRLKGN